MSAPVLALVLGSFGLFIIVLTGVLAWSLRRNRQQVNRLDDGVNRLTGQLRTPEEREREAERRRLIRRRKQEAFELHDHGGV